MTRLGENPTLIVFKKIVKGGTQLTSLGMIPPKIVQQNLHLKIFINWFVYLPEQKLNIVITRRQLDDVNVDLESASEAILGVFTKVRFMMSGSYKICTKVRAVYQNM